MDFEAAVKSIRKTYTILTGKSDVDVILTYKGTGYGVTEPWHVRIDAREAQDKTHDGAVKMLLDKLKKELNDKVLSTEREAEVLRKALNSLGN